MMSVVTWTPPGAELPSESGDNGSLVFRTGRTARFRLLTLQGTESPELSFVLAKGPSQPGETALDVVVPSRLVIVQAMLQAEDLADLRAARLELATALATSPVRIGEALVLGVLSVATGALEHVIPALPRSAAIEQGRGSSGGALADIEFYCPDPWWREPADTALAFDVDDSLAAINVGDIDTPVVARLWGPATSVTLTNVTTGEAFEIITAIASDEFVEVDTTPGRKAVELVDSVTQVRTNVLGALTLADARMWMLRLGSNTVLFEATGDDGDTHAELIWRSLYAGI